MRFSNEEEICSIHQSCDCFVSASRAEAFCIPLANAMLAGKAVIAPNHSGMDYINEKNAFVIRSYPTACFGATDSLPDLYTSQEQWFEVDVDDLREKMRSAYEKRDLSRRKSQQAKKEVQKFSFSAVGEQYKNILML